MQLRLAHLSNFFVEFYKLLKSFLYCFMYLQLPFFIGNFVKNLPRLSLLSRSATSSSCLVFKFSNKMIKISIFQN
ncbi:unnamed protein product [Moneuplotes crassus]|uniref:Uncharacterized protein n=1 Tax=Euplotes crassus TaxID=5936 RepID=A0AAD1X9G3_EUPCR|nr:unnamed protein product [Moneuplotes crassus]